MTSEERIAVIRRMMQERLDRLADFMEADRVREHVEQFIRVHTVDPGVRELRRRGHEIRQRIEWAAVLEHGWIVTRNVHDSGWLEARKGERVVRACTHAGLCLEMACGDYRPGD